MNVTGSHHFYAEAALYTGISLLGYPMAVVFSWAVLSGCRRRHRRDEAVRSPGSFAKLMLALEAVDSIPEAVLVAAATVRGSMTMALAVSMLLLNAVNSAALALDYLATQPPRTATHRIMANLVFFSMGAVTFSVSTTVFQGAHLGEIRPDAVLLACALGGAALGVALTLALVALEHGCAGPDGSDEDADVAMERLYRDLGHTQNLYERVHQHASAEGAAQASAMYQERIEALQRSIESLQTARGLARQTSHLEAVCEARRVLEDQVLVEDVSWEPVPVIACNGDLARRLARLCAAMLLISAWTMGLTLACVPLFQHALAGDYATAFADGLSGGAFLAIISSTLVPRIQHDVNRSRYGSPLTIRLLGTLCFFGGVVLTVVLDWASARA